MAEWYVLGAYWKLRKQTMREYADATRQFLQALCKVHPVFNELFYVGRKPNAEVKLSFDFENLDDLIYKQCWDPKVKYDDANPDGSPSWDTASKLGFGMTFNSGKAPNKSGVRVSIHIGMYSPRLNNAIVITFPPPNHSHFLFPEFYQNEALERLFRLAVNFWKPESALLASPEFRKKVMFEYGSDEYNNNWNVGMLTYLENPEVIKELPPDVLCERLEAGGVMIVASHEIMGSPPHEQVQNAISIRDYLYHKGLLAKKNINNE